MSGGAALASEARKRRASFARKRRDTGGWLKTGWTSCRPTSPSPWRRWSTDSDGTEASRRKPRLAMFWMPIGHWLRPTRPGSSLAKALMKSSTTFSGDEELSVIQEAVDVYRELAEADPEAFLPALVKAARTLSYVGQLDEALRLTREVADICRGPAKSDPVNFLAVLAESLSDLSDLLLKSRPEESLDARIEAAAAYRKLTDTYPDRFRPNLTSSLDLLASGFKTLGKREDELTAVRAAFAAYRERAEHIAEIRRRIVATDLAGLLQAHPPPRGRSSGRARFRELARLNAVIVDAKAAAVFAELAETQPIELRPDLADAARDVAVELRPAGWPRAAWVLAVDLRATGWLQSSFWPPRAARTVANQAYRMDAVAPWSGYGVTRPNFRYVRPLDRMNDLALRLWKLGQWPEAVTAGQASRDLAQATQRDAQTNGPKRRRPARSFTRLWEERKVRWYRKATRIWGGIVRYRRRDWWRLSRKDPDAERLLSSAQQHLAEALERQSESLDTLTFRRQVAGRAADAMPAAQQAVGAQQQAVAVYRERSSKLPPSERSDLARSLDTLAFRLRMAGQTEAARAADDEAGEIRLQCRAASTGMP